MVGGSQHVIHWRLAAEDLVRLRRSDERRRYAAPQRAARIDPNPHQIDAVVFALSRLTHGGCILADEVGLGKTIEAGLIIAQLRTEGAQRVLLLAPKALLGQWRQELFTLFGIEAVEAEPDAEALEAPAVFLMGRELAASDRGLEALLAAARFDLIVIDEAHEVFSGLHKRVNKYGELREDAKGARIAFNIYQLVHAKQTPVLLLTATPIQNSLAELWALVQYVDPDRTLLGDLQTFRDVFCDQDDRALAEGQEHELRRRLDVVLKRTLRRQAQEFLTKPFVGRETRVFEYAMRPDEAALYEDVTRYLMTPNLAAFRGNNRRLLLIAFHRRMASSSAALAESLSNVAARLRRILENSPQDPGLQLLADLDTQDAGDLLPENEGAAEDPEDRYAPDKVRLELESVASFIDRARELVHDGKAEALLQAVRLVLERAAQGKGSAKLVVFTESIVTQEALRKLLADSGLVTDSEITVFRGTNDSPRAQEALERWQSDEGAKLPAHGRPKRDMAMRLALVDEFRKRSKVFISTEAGAKGLNLQFCETVVNYDLPWNPQRIEQRIGRCHRYGQTRDVTVISFIAKDNEADRLLFEILSQKLDLFGTVLDASDNIIYRPAPGSEGTLASALGAQVETSIRQIWERARTLEERVAELRQLRESMEETRRRFDEAHQRTAGLIETHLDGEVRSVFLRRKEELPGALAELDADLERVVTAYLDHLGIDYDIAKAGAARLLTVAPSARLPQLLRDGLKAAIGRTEEHESLHLGHPLVAAAIAGARLATEKLGPICVAVDSEAPEELRALRGHRGRLVLGRLRHEGFEPVERLIPIALFDGHDRPLTHHAAMALLRRPIADTAALPAGRGPKAELMEDAIDEILFGVSGELSAADTARFDRAVEQLERFVDDRLLLRRRECSDLQRRAEVERKRRDDALSSETRAAADKALVGVEEQLAKLGADIDRLERREDALYQSARESIHARRYAPPKFDRLFDVEMVVP